MVSWGEKSAGSPRPAVRPRDDKVQWRRALAATSLSDLSAGDEEPVSLGSANCGSPAGARDFTGGALAAVFGLSLSLPPCPSARLSVMRWLDSAFGSSFGSGLVSA